jgi:hypothetical protein
MRDRTTKPSTTLTNRTTKSVNVAHAVEDIAVRRDVRAPFLIFDGVFPHFRRRQALLRSPILKLPRDCRLRWAVQCSAEAGVSHRYQARVALADEVPVLDQRAAL